MDLAHYYNVSPLEIEHVNTRRLSIMYSAMVINKSSERIRRIEEISTPYMEKKPKEKFINLIFKDIDDDFKDPHMVSEDELKGIFRNGGK